MFLHVHNSFYPSKCRVDGSLHKAILRKTQANVGWTKLPEFWNSNRWDWTGHRPLDWQFSTLRHDHRSCVFVYECFVVCPNSVCPDTRILHTLLLQTPTPYADPRPVTWSQLRLQWLDWCSGSCLQQSHTDAGPLRRHTEPCRNGSNGY